MFRDSIVTVGTNGKCNNLREESHCETGKNNLPPTIRAATQRIQIKSGSEILLNYYRPKHNMWTTFNYYNFYQKLNCDISSSTENNFKTFLKEQCKNTQNYIWRDFKVDFLFKTTDNLFEMFQILFARQMQDSVWNSYRKKQIICNFLFAVLTGSIFWNIGKADKILASSLLNL